MSAIESQIAQLVKDAEELKKIKEKKKEYIRDYCRERKRKLRAEQLGISYDEYVKRLKEQMLNRYSSVVV